MICKLEQNPSPSAYLSDFSTLNGTFLAWFLVLMTCLFQGFEAFYLFASYEEVMETIEVAEEVVEATTQTITKEDNFTELMLLQVVESHKDLNQIFVWYN